MAEGILEEEKLVQLVLENYLRCTWKVGICVKVSSIENKIGEPRSNLH